MFFPLVIIGGFLAVLGGLIFIFDCFKIHVLWGLSAILLPLVSLICLCKHWSETKRGFLLMLLAIPFLTGAFLTMPKPNSKNDKGQVVKINDPFYNAMQKARDTVAKVQDSRKEGSLPVVFAPTPVSEVLPPPVPQALIPTPTPAQTISQRLAMNRASFKSLEADFAALNARRAALPKNNSPAIAEFNLEAKKYADKLASVRAEQAVLLELQAQTKK